MFDFLTHAIVCVTLENQKKFNSESLHVIQYLLYITTNSQDLCHCFIKILFRLISQMK